MPEIVETPMLPDCFRRSGQHREIVSAPMPMYRLADPKRLDTASAKDSHSRVLQPKKDLDMHGGWGR